MSRNIYVYGQPNMKQLTQAIELGSTNKSSEDKEERIVYKDEEGIRPTIRCGDIEELMDNNRFHVELCNDQTERISLLVKELKQRNGQHKELLNENKRLERKLNWADENLIEKLIELSRYRKLVDDLMKTISLLINRVEGHE